MRTIFNFIIYLRMWTEFWISFLCLFPVVNDGCHLLPRHQIGRVVKIAQRHSSGSNKTERSQRPPLYPHADNLIVFHYSSRDAYKNKNKVRQENCMSCIILRAYCPGIVNGIAFGVLFHLESFHLLCTYTMKLIIDCKVNGDNVTCFVFTK